MPTYEYQCRSCGKHHDVVQKFGDDPLTECPSCGGPLRKVFGAVGVVFKGSGFYKTDSRSSSKKSERSDKSEKADKSDTSEKSDKKAAASSDKSGGSSSDSGGSKSSDSSGSSPKPGASTSSGSAAAAS
jgi:putative FmdB family regulatory protein